MTLQPESNKERDVVKPERELRILIATDAEALCLIVKS
jgi:hypothetical protein